MILIEMKEGRRSLGSEFVERVVGLVRVGAVGVVGVVGVKR